jgi:antitoxin component YwqK of YwqJK toxin-antitoxin module
MKILFYIFLLFSIRVFAQTESINKIDSLGKKQGKWIITGKDKAATCYKNYQIIEEGEYNDNKKTGLWTEYYCNGNIRNILTFKAGRPNGYATMFHENGKISEEGFWKNNRYIGLYKLYDSLGVVINEIIFDSLGKKPGNVLVPLDDAREPMTPKYYNKNKTDPNNYKTDPSVLNGKHTLYNKNKQITKDGIFKDNRFMDGKAYIYDENGVLTRIAIYKDGKYVGDASLE